MPLTWEDGSVRIYGPSFRETSPKRSVSMTENERFGLVFAKAGPVNSGTGIKSIVFLFAREKYYQAPQ
jgi:hypothetical protein